MCRPISFAVAVLVSFFSLCDSKVLLAERRSPIRNAGRQATVPDGHWVDTWTAMPQLTEYTNLPPPPFVSKTFQANSHPIRVRAKFFRTNLASSFRTRRFAKRYIYQ